MNVTHFKRWALLALLSTASLTGSITAPTGAVVPHAKITLTQTDTNFTRIATS